MYTFDFSDFKIVNLAFSLRPNESEEEVEFKTNIEIGHDKEGNHLKLFLKLAIDDQSMPFSILVEGAGLFEFNQDIEDKDIDEIAEVNCAAIIFPYIRETVADITRRAGFPPLHLPPVNFVNIFKSKKKHSENKNDQKK
jgi:preprotein translocase subunit SecB